MSSLCGPCPFARRLFRNPFPDLNPFQSLQATPTHSLVEDRTGRLKVNWTSNSLGATSGPVVRLAVCTRQHICCDGVA